MPTRMPRLQQFGLGLHVGDVRLAFHGVQDALRAAFGADPQPVAAHLAKGAGHRLVDAAGAGDTLEGDTQTAPSMPRHIAETSGG
ncbi:MAG: hypothetical protein M9927_22250 [Anaerolineae bacterium]|nr:hypothetical protein [Anaerolineae bacterium]